MDALQMTKKIMGEGGDLTHRIFWEAAIDRFVWGFERRIATKRGHQIFTPLELRLMKRHFPAHHKDKKHKPNCSKYYASKPYKQKDR
jgi:hypothetical protein